MLPLFALAHELGHALIGVARTSSPVRVRVGDRTWGLHWRIGRLELFLSPIVSTAGAVGRTYAASDEMGKWTSAAYAAAGPLASGAFSGVVVLVGVWSGFVPLLVAGAFGLFYSALALVPHELSGLRSDGGRLLDALRAQPSSRNVRSVS